MSELFDPVFGRTAVRAVTDDRAWLRALCAVESALASACAGSGLIPAAAAESIGAACVEVAETDPGDLGRRAAADGNPVIALVAELRSRVPEHSSAVHFGATSQDIVDTAAMLIAAGATALVADALGRLAVLCAGLAETHRCAPMMARTLMQQAVPTTFGALAASWGEGIDRARDAVRGLEFCVSLGGAAGTLAGWHPHGAEVRAAIASTLGLHDPGTVWHAERSRTAAIACALGLTSGVVATIAGDVVLLSQTEIGEVREHVTGGSSTMAHKQNPVAAITARAGAAQAPGLVATLLAAMPGELQRAAGNWHAEWVPLVALLGSTAGAAERLVVSLDGLHVRTDVMAGRVADDRPDLGHAVDLVDAYLGRRA